MNLATTEPKKPVLLEPIRLQSPLKDFVVARLTTRDEERNSKHRAEVEAAYERGRLEGERALSEQLVNQRSEMLALKACVVDSLKDCFPNVIRDCEDTLVQLTIEIARKIVVELPITREMMQGVVKEAINHLAEATDYVVQLNPLDYALMKSLESESAFVEADCKSVRFESNHSVSRGGCVVRTDFGNLDNRRETKWSALLEAIG